MGKGGANVGFDVSLSEEAEGGGFGMDSQGSVRETSSKKGDGTVKTVRIL